MQCSGMSPYGAVPACLKQRLRQRRHRCISYTVGSLYFETGRRKSRLLDRFANQPGRVGEKLLALNARSLQEALKNTARDNPTTPSGPDQDPVGPKSHRPLVEQFLALQSPAQNGRDGAGIARGGATTGSLGVTRSTDATPLPV